MWVVRSYSSVGCRVLQLCGGEGGYVHAVVLHLLVAVAVWNLGRKPADESDKSATTATSFVLVGTNRSYSALPDSMLHALLNFTYTSTRAQSMG